MRRAGRQLGLVFLGSILLCVLPLLCFLSWGKEAEIQLGAGQQMKLEVPDVVAENLKPECSRYWTTVTLKPYLHCTAYIGCNHRLIEIYFILFPGVECVVIACTVSNRDSCTAYCYEGGEWVIKDEEEAATWLADSYSLL